MRPLIKHDKVDKPYEAMQLADRQALWQVLHKPCFL